MPRLFRYQGYLYRVAQETELSAIQLALIQQAQAELQHHGAQGTNLAEQPAPEQDGLDIVMDVGAKWSGVQALATFDYRVQGNTGKLVELVLELCGQFYVAHADKEIEALLTALGTLHKAEFHPGRPQEAVVDKKKAEYIRFLEYYIAELLRGGVELPEGDYDTRVEFIRGIGELAKAERYPVQRAQSLIEGAQQLSDDEWAALIEPLLAAGQRYVSKQELVDQAITQLTQHEQYKGPVHIVDLTQQGEMVVAIEIPPPAQSFKFVFKHVPGQNQLKFQDAALEICHASFASGPDTTMAQQLLSCMVDLTAAAQEGQDPGLSRAPEVSQEPEWTSETLSKALEKGLGVWMMENGGARLVLRGQNPEAGCLSPQEFQHELKAEGTTLKNWMQQVASAKGHIFRIDPDGAVHLMDHNFKPMQKNIVTIDSVGSMKCIVR